MQTISQTDPLLIIYKNHVPEFTITGSTFHIQSKLNETEIELDVTIMEIQTAYMVFIDDLPELEETSNLIMKYGSDSIYVELLKYVS
ncbi:hypothetical protein [Xanthocytophaga agilis]|uniref:Uncharacterized protein n=1 Tax=Xanthocytophaga agilis TaxID=3048010 RepID=A0AAE3R4S0_9BACT|nr:hypothetical protein [Xanthocytophaga agilis]MDJ1500647.1 hypothetical protein [Xanthocytophaga agilis]